MGIHHILLAALLAVHGAEAHIAMWNKGMFGLNYPGQANDTYQNYNNNFPVVPLRHSANLLIHEWFGHGLKEYPPAEGAFMELESGGTFVGELSCNRAWTSYKSPDMARQPMHYYACPSVGPLHVNNKFGEEPDPQYFGGTSIAIAYTSDVYALQPSDMIVISINYTSVWTRLTEYKIPCGLPPCPPGGCLCTWNWIHQAGHGEGYGEEIYNLIYRCNVTGEVNTENELRMGSGQPPVYCANDPERCVTGPKQPLHIWMAEGNNQPWPGPMPTYNQRYGFKDGAQLDIFGDELKTACPEKEPSTESAAAQKISIEEGETVPTEEDPIVSPHGVEQAPMVAKQPLSDSAGATDSSEQIIDQAGTNSVGDTADGRTQAYMAVHGNPPSVADKSPLQDMFDSLTRLAAQWEPILQK